MTFPAMDEDGFGPDDVAAATGVSRETLARVGAWLTELDVWRGRMNLIGPGEGRHVWRRHVLDSLQVITQLPEGPVRLVDMGSGAGFPGALLACALADRPGAGVTLVEKSPRKCEFLRAAVNAVRLPVVVLNQGLDDRPQERFDLATARALAPLSRLLGYASHWLKPSGKAVLLKGRDVAAELAEARRAWSFEAEALPSLSSADGAILVVRSLRPGRS